jgi:hypothetical protein
MIDPKNANLFWINFVDKDVRGSANDPFAGLCNAPGASTARESAEQFYLCMNAIFDGVRRSVAVRRDVVSQLFQIAHGRLTPDELHAVAFNLRALRIAS